MINGAEKHDNNQYVGFNYWPSIIVPCDTCSADVKMSHGKENDDKVFCSRKERHEGLYYSSGSKRAS